MPIPPLAADADSDGLRLPDRSWYSVHTADCLCLCGSCSRRAWALKSQGFQRRCGFMAQGTSSNLGGCSPPSLITAEATGVQRKLA